MSSDGNEISPSPRGTRLIRTSDTIVLYLVLMPVMAISVFWYRGLLGIAIGMGLAIGIWIIYVTLKYTALVIATRISSRKYSDRDLHKILRAAFVSMDYDEAVSQIQDLITRDGESYQRLFSLSGTLCWNGRYEAALQAILKAKEIAPVENNRDWLVNESACLRLLGRLDEAHALSSQLVLEQPTSFHAQLEHAKVLAELGRCSEAHAYLEKARSFLKHRLLIRVSIGRTYLMAIQHDFDRAENLVFSRCAAS